MEQVTFQQSSQELIKQLESILARMAVAADSGMSTYYLEDAAKKLSSKLKESAFLNGLTMYKDIEDLSHVYRPEQELSDDLFMKLAKLCKIKKDQADVYKKDSQYFDKFSDNLYIDISSVDSQPIPEFKVKLEGDTLIAVRKDLFDKLPQATKKLLNNKGDEKKSDELKQKAQNKQFIKYPI
jgi:hypothetical protein